MQWEKVILWCLTVCYQTSPVDVQIREVRYREIPPASQLWKSNVQHLMTKIAQMLATLAAIWNLFLASCSVHGGIGRRSKATPSVWFRFAHFLWRVCIRIATPPAPVFFFPRTLSHCRPSVSLTLCPVCHELFDGSPRANHMTESIVQANFRVHSFDQRLRIQAIHHHHHHVSAMNHVVHDGHHR